MTALDSSDALRARLASRLATNQDGVIEALAQEHGVTTLEATRMLPAVNCRWTSAAAFNDIFAELTTWGDILFIVHTPNIIFECVGPVPPGTTGRGFFNLGGKGPIGGHIRAERCAAIAFVTRPFMGLDTRSIQFFDTAGDAMFKIFVRRREDRSLDDAQVAAFDDMAKRFALPGS